ncbi:MAG TPA: hypothetical protein VEZ89_17285 [Rubrivivax sp.]|nr:hypothetical protein [Rubrivivax sp.]
MHTIHPSRFLKVALFADAVVSGAVALLQLLAGQLLAGLLALPAVLLLESGVFLIVYVGLLLAMATRPRLWSWLVWAVIAGNVGWAVGCLSLLKLLPALGSDSGGQVTSLGVAFLLVQAFTVLVFALLQWRGWRASSLDDAGQQRLRQSAVAGS